MDIGGRQDGPPLRELLDYHNGRHHVATEAAVLLVYGEAKYAECGELGENVSREGTLPLPFANFLARQLLGHEATELVAQCPDVFWLVGEIHRVSPCSRLVAGPSAPRERR